MAIIPPEVMKYDWDTSCKFIIDVTVVVSRSSMTSTIKTTKHIPCGFAYKVVCLTSETSKQPVVYRGLDAAEKFVEHMVMEQEDIEQKFKHYESMKMSGSYWQARTCGQLSVYGGTGATPDYG
jgi:hypothetical protein